MSSRNPNCEACALHRQARTVCIDGDGDPHAEILFVGEAPGAQEDRYGRPFVGPSGQLIRSLAMKAGFKSVRFTNVVRCRPPGNAKPTPDQIKACQQYLRDEITEVSPKWIVPLGAIAAKAMARKPKIKEAHGQIIERDGMKIMPTYHPAYALRDPSKLPAIEHDLARLKRTIAGTIGIGNFQYRVIHDGEDFSQFIAAFREARDFSFDTETTGLLVHAADFRIRCLGIGLADCAWVLPLEMPGSIMLGQRELQLRVYRLIHALAQDKFTIAQNGKYDNNGLYQVYGSRFHLGFDTMLASHLIDENQDHGLKYLSRVHLDCPEYDLSTAEKKGSKLHTPEGRERYWEYNARDCWNTYHLKAKFDAVLKRDMRLRRLFYQLVMPAARAMERIECRGLTLDLPKFALTEIQIRTELDELLRWLNHEAKINWNAPAQVAQVLFGKLNLKSTVKTPTGNPSTSEAALVELKGQHPLADKLIEYREKAKFLSTYIEGWKELTIGDRLYFSYKLHGTVTGRYSSRLHSVPRDGTIRNLVIGTDEWEFCQADLSQAELRIAAELSGDLELVNCFRAGGQDVHWRTLLYMIASGKASEYTEQTLKTATNFKHGQRVLTLTEAIAILTRKGHDEAIANWKGWKEARKKAKAVNFGFVFGMFENKFIEQAKLKYGWDCTWDEAHEMREAYFELYPGIPQWHERQKKIVRIDGQVTNLFGRVRRLPGIQSTDRELRGEAERQAINSPVQGTIGDWKAAAMVEIEETLPVDKIQIVGEHHDALLMMVRKDSKDQMLPKVHDIMCHPRLLDIFKINMRVPMEAEIELGPWGAGKKWEKK